MSKLPRSVWPSLMISPAVQALFNNAKGSMPVRDDVDMSLADPCMQKGLAIIKDPANIAGRRQRWLTNDTTNQINDLFDAVLLGRRR